MEAYAGTPTSAVDRLELLHVELQMHGADGGVQTYSASSVGRSGRSPIGAVGLGGAAVCPVTDCRPDYRLCARPACRLTEAIPWIRTSCAIGPWRSLLELPRDTGIVLAVMGRRIGSTDMQVRVTHNGYHTRHTLGAAPVMLRPLVEIDHHGGEGPPSSSEPAVSRPSSRETDESSAYAMLIRLSRPRLATPRLAVRRCGGPSQRAGDTASAAGDNGRWRNAHEAQRHAHLAPCLG
jgi:hypothetical protein